MKIMNELNKLSLDILDDETVDFPVIRWKSDNDMDDLFSINEKFPTLSCIVDSRNDESHDEQNTNRDRRKSLSHFQKRKYISHFILHHEKILRNKHSSYTFYKKSSRGSHCLRRSLRYSNDLCNLDFSSEEENYQFSGNTEE